RVGTGSRLPAIVVGASQRAHLARFTGLCPGPPALAVDTAPHGLGGASYAQPANAHSAAAHRSAAARSNAHSAAAHRSAAARSNAHSAAAHRSAAARVGTARA